MIKKLSVGFAALAAMGIAGAASAQATDDFSVDVNINVAENVSFWTSLNTVDLNMDGGAENSDFVTAQISHINNVSADITAEVTGDLPPTAGDPSGAINFFLFPDMDATAANTATAANANDPAGGVKWTQANLGTSQAIKSVAVSQNIDNFDITYGVSAPNVLPLPDTYALVVTYTMTGN